MAGNHDRCLEQGNRSRHRARSILTDRAVYLEDDKCVIDGVCFYGSPWTPAFQNWAFMNDEETLGKYFRRIPEETDVLVTHGPPRGTLDEAPIGKKERRKAPTVRDSEKQDHSPELTKSVGSTVLMDAVNQVRPDFHIFGHIHESYGREDRDETTFINASVVDGDYEFSNNPVVIVL